MANHASDSIKFKKIISANESRIHHLGKAVSNQVCDLLEKDHISSDLRDEKASEGNDIEKVNVELSSQSELSLKQEMDMSACDKTLMKDLELCRPLLQAYSE